VRCAIQAPVPALRKTGQKTMALIPPKRRFRGGELEGVVDGDSDAGTVFDDAGR
jgi:hypothetical protein